MPNYKGDKVTNTGVWYTDDGSKTTGATQAHPATGPDGAGKARSQTDLYKVKGYVAAPHAQLDTQEWGVTRDAALARL